MIFKGRSGTAQRMNRYRKTEKETRDGSIFYAPETKEYTRDIPKHFDSGDIDNDGRWYGSSMCCLECRTTDAMRMGAGGLFLLATLECGSCGEVFAERWL
jgi:hypothetical protein